MKPFLLLQLRPEDETSNNEYETFLTFGGLAEDELVRMRIEKNGIPDDLDIHDYAGIMVGGSPFDISTPEDKKSDIQKKIEADFDKLLEQIVAEDFPFLGACSGNGLLGHYLGTPISTKYGETVEGVNLILTEAGKQDPLLKGMPDGFRALAGHKEACDVVPEGAVLLASTKNCPVHMFRVGENVYATQFHPEADAAAFMLRIDVYKSHGYFPEEDAQKLTDAVKDEKTPYANEVLKRFVDRYRSK